MTSRGIITTAVRACDQPQFPRATTAMRMVVMSITLVTAMPYAAARSLEVRNTSTNPTQPTNRAQFTSGT